MKKERPATISDFKVGQVMSYPKGGFNFRLLRKYDHGIWEARFPGGIRCVMESEVRHYTVNV